MPLDFVEDLAGQRKLTVDREGFERAMEGQRERARASSAFKGGIEGVAWQPSTPRASASWSRPAIASKATTALAWTAP